MASADDGLPSLDLRQFRSEPGAPEEVVVSFEEHRGEVWAVFSGGDVRRGYFVGGRDGAGVTGRFVERTTGGDTRCGRLEAQLYLLDDGRLRWQETWTLESDDGRGERVLLQVATPEEPAEVTLREVTEHNIGQVLRLEVAPHQTGFVATVPVSIAQAHHNDVPGWYRAIYADEEPVGFVMLAFEDGPGVKFPGHFLWRFLIDQRHQRSGYGRRALELVCDHVRRSDPPHVLWTSWVEGPGGPEPFYRSFGFVPTGDIDDGEIVARLEGWPGDPARET